MPSDPLHKTRLRARYILEVRYKPIVAAFDRRGQVLGAVFPLFESKAPHWRAQSAQISIADDFDHVTRLIEVGHLRTRILYEDPASRQEFLDDARRLLDAVCSVFPGDLHRMVRMGFRTQAVHRHASANSFAAIRSDLQARFLAAKLPTSLVLSDLAVTLEQDNSRTTVGPVQNGENWLKDQFADPELGEPGYGVGLDVDAFLQDVQCSDQKDLAEAAKRLEVLALAIEQEILAGMV